MSSRLFFRALLRYGNFLVLLTAVLSTVQSQSVDQISGRYPAAGINRPLLVVVADTPADSAWLSLILEHQVAQNYNLLLLADSDTIGIFCEQANSVLNEESINKKRVYLLGILPKEKRAKYNVLDLSIIAATHWADRGEVQDQKALDLIWTQLSVKTLWTYDVELVQKKAKIVERSKRVEGGVGMNLMTTSTHFRSDALGLPSGMRFWSYNAYRRVYPRWFLNFSVDVGLNRPDPQEILFDQILEQVDVFSLLAGDEVEVDLDVELTGHLSGALGVGLSYLLVQEGKTIPYAGLDMRFFAANFLYAKIDTTILIDGTSALSGGADPADFDFNDQDEGLSATSTLYLTLCPHVGMYQELGDRWLLDLNASYQPDPASWKGESEHFSMLRFSMGLRYRLLGKRTTHYEYLRIAARP